MEWSIPVRRGEAEVARLRCNGDGLRTGFFLSCPAAEEIGVEKLWLEGNGRFLLGTPIPKAGTLTLRRVVSNRQLESLRPIVGGVLTGVGGGNAGAALPAAVRDPELRALLQGSGYHLTTQGDTLLLTWPWHPGAPLPVPALGTLMDWREGELILKLNHGWPVAEK
jgi:hypothetical protein